MCASPWADRLRLTVGGVPLPLGRGTFPVHVRAGPPSAGTSRLLDTALLSAHAWPVGQRLTIYAQLHGTHPNPNPNPDPDH